MSTIGSLDSEQRQDDFIEHELVKIFGDDYDRESGLTQVFSEFINDMNKRFNKKYSVKNILDFYNDRNISGTDDELRLAHGIIKITTENAFIVDDLISSDGIEGKGLDEKVIDFLAMIHDRSQNLIEKSTKDISDDILITGGGSVQISSNFVLHYSVSDDVLTSKITTLSNAQLQEFLDYIYDNIPNNEKNERYKYKIIAEYISADEQKINTQLISDIFNRGTAIRTVSVQKMNLSKIRRMLAQDDLGDDIEKSSAQLLGDIMYLQDVGQIDISSEDTLIYDICKLNRQGVQDFFEFLRMQTKRAFQLSHSILKLSSLLGDNPNTQENIRKKLINVRKEPQKVTKKFMTNNINIPILQKLLRGELLPENNEEKYDDDSAMTEEVGEYDFTVDIDGVILDCNVSDENFVAQLSHLNTLQRGEFWDTIYEAMPQSNKELLKAGSSERQHMDIANYTMYIYDPSVASAIKKRGKVRASTLGRFNIGIFRRLLLGQDMYHNMLREKKKWKYTSFTLIDDNQDTQMNTFPFAVRHDNELNDTPKVPGMDVVINDDFSMSGFIISLNSLVSNYSDLHDLSGYVKEFSSSDFINIPLDRRLVDNLSTNSSFSDLFDLIDKKTLDDFLYVWAKQHDQKLAGPPTEKRIKPGSKEELDYFVHKVWKLRIEDVIRMKEKSSKKKKDNQFGSKRKLVHAHLEIFNNLDSLSVNMFEDMYSDTKNASHLTALFSYITKKEVIQMIEDYINNRDA